MPESEIDFEKASRGIIATLRKQTSTMKLDEVIKHVYNSAIDDAAMFTQDMAKDNPQFTIAYTALERTLLEMLRLR